MKKGYSPIYSLRRNYVDDFHLAQVHRIAKSGKVLDLGGNKILKRGVFDIEKYDLDVVYTNLTPVKRPDTLADAAFLPFSEGAFDAVICSELLEHVFDPSAVLREAYRVMKPEGLLLICVPFLFPVHGDPDDFGRYTHSYWSRSLGTMGFDVVLMQKQGAFWSVLADMIAEHTSYVTTHTVMGKRPLGTALKGISRLLKGIAYKMDAAPSIAGHAFYGRYTTGYGIVAQKPVVR